MSSWMELVSIAHTICSDFSLRCHHLLPVVEGCSFEVYILDLQIDGIAIPFWMLGLMMMMMMMMIVVVVADPVKMSRDRCMDL